MTSRPAVSVIMPVFNAQGFLAEAIESVLNQTFTDFELIIVDDASTDGSPGIVRGFAEKDSRVRPYFQAVNSGAIGARNHALTVARAAIVANMDADDVSLPDRFAKQIAFLNSHPEIVAVGSYVQVIDEQGKLGAVKQYPTTSALATWSLFFFNSMAHPAVMMRRDAVTAAGSYAEDTKGTWAEDYALFTKLSRQGGISNVPEVLLNYRQSSSNTTSKYWEIQEREASRIVQRSVLSWTGIDIGLEGGAAFRGLSTGRYPSSGAEANKLALVIDRLCRSFVASPSLQKDQRNQIRLDAAVKILLLAAIMMRHSPLSAPGVAWRGIRMNWSSPLAFVAKVSRNVLRTRA